MDSIRLEATYAGRGYEKPHHLFTEVVQIDHGMRKAYRDGHAWLNAEFSGFPDGIEHGAKVRFWASYFPRKGGQRLTECREIEIIKEGQG